MADDMDNLEEFEAKETSHALPAGWLLLFIGVILFAIVYFFAYTPAISGWSQISAYEQSLHIK
ncbi:MAG: hypothetical protein M0Z75_09060 [Nitrospiraceae bacterium]|nr:hypothetical protein [Nitrospiraceae bacterium]